MTKKFNGYWRHTEMVRLGVEKRETQMRKRIKSGPKGQQILAMRRDR